MKCVCASLRPGMTVRPPASMTRVAAPRSEASSASPPTAAIFSPLIASAAAKGRAGSSVATRPLTISTSADPADVLVTAGTPPAPRSGIPSAQAVADLHVLWLELDSRHLRLLHEQHGEILLGH